MFNKTLKTNQIQKLATKYPYSRTEINRKSQKNLTTRKEIGTKTDLLDMVIETESEKRRFKLEQQESTSHEEQMESFVGKEIERKFSFYEFVRTKIGYRLR